MARVAFLWWPIMRRAERSACREFGPRGRCLVHAWCGSRLWFCSGFWFWIYAVAAQSVWRAIYAVMPGVLRLLLSGELLFSLFFCELSPRCPDMRGLGHADFFWSRLQRHGLLHLGCCWLCLALGLRCCGCMLGGRCNMRVPVSAYNRMDWRLQKRKCLDIKGKGRQGVLRPLPSQGVLLSFQKLSRRPTHGSGPLDKVFSPV